MLYSMLANETAGSISSQERRVCLGVIVTESIVIFIINAYTPIVFARNRHLRKNSTYLIINLTVADLLVGAVSEPLELYWSEPIDFWPGFSTSWKDFSILIFFSLFPISSLTNLSFISLERLHATLYPIMHFVIGKWVYFKAVILQLVVSFASVICDGRFLSLRTRCKSEIVGIMHCPHLVDTHNLLCCYYCKYQKQPSSSTFWASYL